MPFLSSAFWNSIPLVVLPTLGHPELRIGASTRWESDGSPTVAKKVGEYTKEFSQEALKLAQDRGSMAGEAMKRALPFSRARAFFP